MARARFVPNIRFPSELVHSTLLEDDLRAAAEDIADHVRAIAPVESGEYRESIEAGAGMGADGVQGIVNANAPYSAYLEFGTEDTPAEAPLRRGAQSAGYRLRSS